MEGSHRVAVQHDQKGYFAEVALRIEPRSERGLQVHIADHSEWSAGVLFGIAWAYERAVHPKSGMTVTVASVRGHVVDTTEVVTAFAAANAFYAAIGKPAPEQLRFDPATGVFTFPK